MDWARTGRKYARNALELFFKKQEEHVANCGCNPLSYDAERCVECLKQEAYEVFHEMMLVKSMGPSSGPVAPEDPDDEAAFNEAAIAVIDRAIERNFKDASGLNPAKGKAKVTDPEEAYELGWDIMRDIIPAAGKELTSADFEGDVTEVLKEKTWALYEAGLTNGTLSVPDVSSAIRPYYDRGLAEGLENGIRIAQAARFQRNLIRRAMRYNRKYANKKLDT